MDTLTCVAIKCICSQGCIGQAMFAAYLWRIGQPKLLSAGPAPEHGATADAQLALLWMILVRPDDLASTFNEAAGGTSDACLNEPATLCGLTTGVVLHNIEGV